VTNPARCRGRERSDRPFFAPPPYDAVGSDAFFPFGDNVERAHKSGEEFIAEPGGSIRDDNVIETADKYGTAMCFTGMRLFHH
jgi:AICAR transformylase/IMP cyclohydrolase PurH